MARRPQQPLHRQEGTGTRPLIKINGLPVVPLNIKADDSNSVSSQEEPRTSTRLTIKIPSLAARMSMSSRSPSTTSTFTSTPELLTNPALANESETVAIGALLGMQSGRKRTREDDFDLEELLTLCQPAKKARIDGDLSETPSNVLKISEGPTSVEPRKQLPYEVTIRERTIRVIRSPGYDDLNTTSGHSAVKKHNSNGMTARERKVVGTIHPREGYHASLLATRHKISLLTS